MNTSAAVLFMLGLATLATCSEASWGPIWGPQPRLRIRRLGRYGSRVPYNQAQARRYQAMNDHPKESCMARCERKFSQSGQRATEKCLYRCGLPPSDAAEEKLDAVEPWDGYTEYSRGSFVTYRWGGQTKTYRKISSQCMPYPQANAWICNSPYRDRDNWEEIERGLLETFSNIHKFKEVVYTVQLGASPEIPVLERPSEKQLHDEVWTKVHSVGTAGHRNVLGEMRPSSLSRSRRENRGIGIMGWIHRVQPRELRDVQIGRSNKDVSENKFAMHALSTTERVDL